MICRKHKHSSEKSARQCAAREYYRKQRQCLRRTGMTPTQIREMIQGQRLAGRVEAIQLGGWLTVYRYFKPF